MRNNCNIGESGEEQSTIPNVLPNITNTTTTFGESERYVESGNCVIFPKVGLRFHKSFSDRYEGMDIVSAKRKLKPWFTHSQKDEICHYLKNNGIIRNKN